MTSPEGTERKARQLPRWARAICWIFGVGFGGVGSYAVFATENQVGTGALLILSALFSIIALTGRVPQRLKLGENSVEWPEEWVDAVATAIEEGSPEVAGKVVSAIAESVPGRVAALAIDRMSGATAERLAQATLMLAVVELEAETGDTFTVLSRSHDGMVDLQVVRENSNDGAVHDEVPIVVKRVGMLKADFARRLAEYADTSMFGRVVLILYGELTGYSRHVLSKRSNVYVAEVGGSLRFEEAVDRVSQRLRSAFNLES